MAPPEFRLIGRGVYSLEEAERLTGVRRSRIRRWTEGERRLGRGRRAPVVPSEIRRITGLPGVDFADLLEVRFLDAFRRRGVSWPAIRTAARRARAVLHRTHPFSSRRFMTDGHTILTEIVDEQTGDPVLLDLVRDQVEFRKIVAPFLFEGIEFDEDQPRRWWPLGRERSVVIDPARAFGAPIVARRGVPTSILAAAMRAEGSIELVSAWYRVDADEVRDAIEYESRRRA